LRHSASARMAVTLVPPEARIVLGA
jgi:hypothetical protein